MATQTKTYPLVENAINVFGDWLKRRRQLRELHDLNGDDFARVARDLCMSPTELDTMVSQGPHASGELPRLLKSIGIDRTTLSRTQSLMQRDMIRVCAACQQKARCHDDIRAGTLAQRYEEYCPNAPA